MLIIRKISNNNSFLSNNIYFTIVTVAVYVAVIVQILNYFLM